MIDIYKYNILNPVPDKTRAFVKNGIFYVPINEKYKYYLEVSQDNSYGGVDYFILFGKTKFNRHCKSCQCDNFGHIKLRLKGAIKDYVFETCERYGNINVDYVESNDYYDVFSVESD